MKIRPGEPQKLKTHLRNARPVIEIFERIFCSSQKGVFQQYRSVAACQEPTTRPAAMERDPVARCSISDSKILTVCFSWERSFRSHKNSENEGQKTADTVEKLCFENRHNSICDLRPLSYSRNEGVVDST